MIYWASWSEESLADLGDIQNTLRWLKKKGIKVLFISVDNILANKNETAKLLGLPKENNIRVDYNSSLTKKKGFRLGKAPTYQIVKKGEIVNKRAPSPISKDFKTLLIQYLKEK